MAQDVFSRTSQQFGGAISADATRVVFSGDGYDQGIGLILANVQVMYAQDVRRAYEIGSDKTYLIIGRTQGSANLSGVFGPKTLHTGFYTKFGNGCNADQNNLSLLAAAGCTVSAGATSAAIGGTAAAASIAGGTLSVTLKHCVINQFQLAIAAQDMAINNAVAIQFNSLEL